MFIQQLMTMNSISKERAIAITETYPTPSSLFQAIARRESGVDGGEGVNDQRKEDEKEGRCPRAKQSGLCMGVCTGSAPLNFLPPSPDGPDRVKKTLASLNYQSHASSMPRRLGPAIAARIVYHFTA